MELKYKGFTIENTPIGHITIVYTNHPNLLIRQIILSTPDKDSKEIAKEEYEKIIETNYNQLNKPLKELVLNIKSYFKGDNIQFSHKNLDLSHLTHFQKLVLKAESKTKRGTVNTYGELASKIKHPKAYRAVGNTLAKNPFPIIIPCHRTIKADRTIGGFNGYVGGLESKEILLSLEGIEIQEKKVISESPIISLNKKNQTKLI